MFTTLLYYINILKLYHIIYMYLYKKILIYRNLQLKYFRFQLDQNIWEYYFYLKSRNSKLHNAIYEYCGSSVVNS